MVVATLVTKRMPQRRVNGLGRGRCLEGGNDMGQGTCSVEGCEREGSKWGWCWGHFKVLTAVERFWARVKKTPDHWEWTGVLSRLGYGSFMAEGHLWMVHRYSYELLVGPIPEGLTLDHLCRVRHCVWPEHLEPVTLQENILRGSGPIAQHAVKTHCDRGHPFNEENTRIRMRNGRPTRVCKVCKNEDERRRYHAAKAP